MNSSVSASSAAGGKVAGAGGASGAIGSVQKRLQQELMQLMVRRAPSKRMRSRAQK
jgi:hypothetical protein